MLVLQYLIYSRPFVSTGSAFSDSNNPRSKIVFKKVNAVADMYDIVKPKMIASVLNMHRLFFWSLSPKQYSVTTIYIAFILYQVL